MQSSAGLGLQIGFWSNPWHVSGFKTVFGQILGTFWASKRFLVKSEAHFGWLFGCLDIEQSNNQSSPRWSAIRRIRSRSRHQISPIITAQAAYSTSATAGSHSSVGVHESNIPRHPNRSHIPTLVILSAPKNMRRGAHAYASGHPVRDECPLLHLPSSIFHFSFFVALTPSLGYIVPPGRPSV